MNPYNPYQAPQTMDPGGGVPDAQEPALFSIMAAMKRTRPWVLFLSILGFLGAGLMVMIGFFVMIAGAATSSFMKGPMAGLGPGLGFAYMLIGALYVVPSVLLWRYGSAIGDYTASNGSMGTLASAVEKQASFWRFVGILTAVMIGLYFVLIFVAVVIGAASAIK